MGKKKRRRNKIRISRVIFVIGFIMVITVVTAMGANMLIEKIQNKLEMQNSVLTHRTVMEDRSSKWNLILVNPWNELPVDFSINRTELENGHSVDERIFEDLQSMLKDAREEGLSPIICSSYRSNEKQESLFFKQINRHTAEGYSDEDAVVEAAKWVAVPGTSEHQTGLAVDIVAESNQLLNKEQENTEEQKWLMENSYKYGFVLRYPEDKSHITGISYEPWHYRYVGKDAAQEIYQKGICLEEYLNQVQSPDLKQSIDEMDKSKKGHPNYECKSLLVNYSNPVPDDYEVELCRYYAGLGEKFYIAKEIESDLSNLMRKAEDQGIILCINSAYRSKEDQEKIFNNKVEEFILQGISEKDAEFFAVKWVAKPGTSEHETGLAIDFGVCGGTTWEDGYSWLEENSYKYGFILRYPSDKIEITKVEHEPWHFRYVGKETAEEIYEQGVCLEEYLNEVIVFK